jgi:hypothetical protein
MRIRGDYHECRGGIPWRTGATSVLVALLVASCFFLARRIVIPPAVHAKVVAIPFVLTEEAASPPESQCFAKWTVARRPDGSTVRIEYLRPIAS